MSENCIFCKIIKDKNNLVFENESLTILCDIRPLSRGHLLVIPKKHCAYMHELDDEDLSQILPLIKKVVNLCGYEKYNILQNNGHIQSVFHVHFHIVPCNAPNDSLKVIWDTVDVEENYLDQLFEKTKALLSEIKK